MAKHDDCVRDEDFRRLEAMVASVFSKMDSFLADMRQIAVGDAKYQERVETLRRDTEALYQKVRGLEVKTEKSIEEVKKTVSSIEQWKDNFVGRMQVMVGIPSVLATVFVIMQIWEVVHK